MVVTVEEYDGGDDIMSSEGGSALVLDQISIIITKWSLSKSR